MKQLMAMALIGIWAASAQAADPAPFKSDSEAGAILAGGNSNSKSLSLKTENTYRFGNNSLTGKGRYLFGMANGFLSARNWGAQLRYDRIYSENFSSFIANLWESDSFGGLNYRGSADLGAKWTFFKTDTTTAMTEAGYRFSYERAIEGSPVMNRRSHIARLFAEINQKVTSAANLRFWAEFLPDLADSANWRLDFEPSVQVALAEHFALKAGYLGRYRQTPAKLGAKQFDYVYTTSLVISY